MNASSSKGALQQATTAICFVAAPHLYQHKPYLLNPFVKEPVRPGTRSRQQLSLGVTLLTSCAHGAARTKKYKEILALLNRSVILTFL
jgi:hypothetical protein